MSSKVRPGSATSSNSSPPTSRALKKQARSSSCKPLSALNPNQYNNRGSIGSLPPRSPSSLGSNSPRFNQNINGTNGEAVRVAVRCRPPMNGEKYEDMIVSMDTEKKEIYLDGEGQVWKVDSPIWSCKGETVNHKMPCSQAALYEQIGRPLLLHALEGYNSTMMAYGQTGSGKTHTMMGGYKFPDDKEAGLIPRLCRDLFVELRSRTFTARSGESFSWEVHVRYIEVYCEKITDLLNNNAPVGIREEVTPDSATFALIGARRIKAERSEDLLQALILGNKSRHTASTKANDHSSRSHAIFVIELTELLSFEEPDGTVVSAPSKALTIRLVDLAGSERVSETGVQGQQLKEARDINRSLFTLGLVIESLTDSRRQIKPPYRDSVLTKILRDAFGGNSKTTMICAISPMEEHRSQTMQTLAYASKARRVVNRPVVEEDPSAVELRRANEELINLRKELNEAKRTGQQYGSIEEQLKEAYEKIKRDQLEMREKKQTMEKREADLANRLREVELKKQEYEAQMASLENEVELARSQQQKREEELRKAYAHADEVAKVRLQQLQEQRDASEQALRAKEEELLSQQHVVEERLADLETTSRARVEELLRRQRDLEEELRMKEKMAVKREQDLRKKTELAEEQARHLSRHTHLVEEEWNAKVQEIERRSKERESEISKRAETAQARLQALEDEARRKDEEMRRKRLDAEAQARTLEAEMETKQAELDRRILELRRQADARENELNEKLHKAEFELRKKERESLESKEALDALKETAARESELSRSRELDLSAQHAKMAETVVSREAALKKREADLNKQFEELLQTKKEWEREYRQKEEELRVGQEESLAILRGRGTYLKQKESELRQIEEDIESKTRILEMETQRKELEFESRRNDLEAQLQRENYANLRAKEELQFQLDRQQTDMRLQQEKLQRWEEDLLKRRTETEKAFQHRETTLRQRESAAANAEDRANAKESQAEKLVKRLEHERRELFDRSINEAESNRKEYNSMLIRLKRQQREIDALHRAASEEQQSTSSRSVSIKGDEIDQIMTAQKALFRRELYSMMAFESLYRGSIIVEEDTEYRTLMKEKQMEMRDIKRVMEIRNQMGELSILRGETDRANDEHSKAQDRLREYQCENENLKEEISRCMNESAQLRLQLSMTTSIARDAEDSLQRVNRDLDVSRVQVESVERELRVSLSEAHATCAEEMRRANRLARGLNNMIFEEEERERAQLELQFSRDVTWMKNLALAERKNVERLEAIGKWESLYEERSAIGLGGDARAVDLNASDLHDQIAKNHALNACQEGLNADLAQLQKRIDEFDAYQRAQLRILGDHENSIQQYLLELEEMDKARMKQYREREQELLKIATQLKDKENMTGDQLQGVCKALFAMANEPCTGGVPRHIIEEDGRRRMERMEKDRELLRKALEGDTAALEELKRRQDEHLQVEECILLRRMDLADEEELKRRKRLQEQEEQILQYLLLLEQEDIRRGRTSKDGDQLFRDAEARLQKAKTKENNLRDLARRLQLEALELEEQSRLMESNLQIRERDLELLRERKETIEGRRAEANSRVDDTERTLLDLETDLRALLNKNKDTKRIMKAREAEIKRQRLFYKDLSKMLEERDRMLLEEHNHRMDGKKSANWLARDLLDYNDKLKKYVKTTRQRWLTLLNEDLLECDLCNWKNGKLMKFCKCCGHDLLLGDPELLDSKL